MLFRSCMSIIAKKRRRTTSKKVSRASGKKVRLAIECSSEERKFIKMFAAHEDKTINDFVLECVRLRVYKCAHPHVPNKTTKAAMREADHKKDLNSYSSIDDFLQSLEK